MYHVTSSQAVDPTDVAVVAPTPTPMLTLTTCNPRYSASQRLVVQAALVADVLTGSTRARPPPVGTHTPRRRQLADTPIRKDWWAAIGWGLAVAALVIGLWILAARLHGGRKAAVVIGGTVVWLGVVYLFFGALAPLLPGQLLTGPAGHPVGPGRAGRASGRVGPGPRNRVISREGAAGSGAAATTAGQDPTDRRRHRRRRRRAHRCRHP